MTFQTRDESGLVADRTRSRGTAGFGATALFSKGRRAILVLAFCLPIAACGGVSTGVRSPCFKGSPTALSFADSSQTALSPSRDEGCDFQSF